MPDAFVIEGGAELRGTIEAGGAKNSATKLLAATLLAPGLHRLTRVPRLADVEAMLDVIRHLGAKTTWMGPNVLEVDCPDELGIEAPYAAVRKMRASTAVLGPLVARTGRARIPLPGGCNLGHRGIDLHQKGLERLGAKITVAHGFQEAYADDLKGCEIELDYPSHGATETIMMTAVRSDGTTVIRNASREPEIEDLAGYLIRMGARISGQGSSEIEITGVTDLRPATFEVMPDRLEAGTYLFAGAATSGDLTVTNLVPQHLERVCEKLTECGHEVKTTATEIRVRGARRSKAADVSTLPYPGFPTDLQPLAVALLTRADGTSIVTENIFDGRFMFVDELARMGADVHTEGHYVVVKGTDELTGAPINAPDLRAGAALVVAALMARGTTILEDVLNVDRGYENMEGRLTTVGASIRRTTTVGVM